jgi:hypothetical protein
MTHQPAQIPFPSSIYKKFKGSEPSKYNEASALPRMALHHIYGCHQLLSGIALKP